MTQEQYDKLRSEIPNVDLVRPFWNEQEYHKDLWNKKSVTVLICQRKTKHAIQLCIESLFRFYPDVNVLVVDGNSEDDSLLYLKWKSALYPNLKVWERTGRNSHGETMHEAITKFIKTRFVILMDSDVVIMRGGWIEEMMKQFDEDSLLYATGSRMLVTRRGEACNVPDDENDVLQYAHPSLSMYHVETYKTLFRFVDHGAACCHNNTDAEAHGLKIGYYPVDKYVAHLSGHSWCDPQPIWSCDNDSIVRPLITFIPTKNKHLEELKNQTYHDFDIVTKGNLVIQNYAIHDGTAGSIANNLFDIRFNVFGEYVCYLNEAVTTIDKDFVRIFANEVAIHPDETLTIGGIQLIKRKLWQRTGALQ